MLGIIPGGSSVPMLPKDICEDAIMDFDWLREQRSGLGTAAVIVMDQNTNGWIRDRDMAEVVEIAMSGNGDLSPGQLEQFHTYLADKFNAWEFAYLTHESGMMEDNIWQRFGKPDYALAFHVGAELETGKINGF